MISLAQWHALLSEVGALSNPVVCPPMAMLLRQGLVVGELECVNVTFCRRPCS